MRLLHVVPTYFPAVRYGGPIYSVHALCRALAARGHDVHVYTTNVDGSSESRVALCEPVDLDGVKVSYFPTGLGRRVYRSPQMARALKRDIKRFDMLHLHSVFLWPTSAAASAARHAGIPYVIAPRGMLVSDLIRRKNRVAKTAWIKVLERRNMAKAAAVHVTSGIEEAELEKLDLEAPRIANIPNGIDFPEKEIAGLAPLHRAGSGRATVLSLGRINWKKGLDKLIQAMVELPSADLVIAGNDDEGYQSQLESLAKSLGIADRVAFRGPVYDEKKWQLISSADVFALPSQSENFGIAALEAMSAGVPVVLTPGVGLADTVREVGCGVVVDADPQVIGRAIADLLANPKRHHMGEAGRRAAVERFSWETIARSMEALYCDINPVSGYRNNPSTLTVVDRQRKNRP